MKHLAVVAAVLFAASCASAPKPKTPAEMLAGTWMCESKPSFGAIKSTITYTPDGKAAAKLSVSGSGGALAVEAEGDVEATWSLVEEDTKLEQTLGAVTITSAKLNGQSVDPGMAQAMIGPFLSGQSATAAIKVDQTNLTLTSAEGLDTTCTR